MRYCPKCGRNYSEDFAFCLEDGSPLLLQSSQQSPMINTFSSLEATRLQAPFYQARQEKKSRLGIVTVFVVLFAGFLVALGAAMLLLVGTSTNQANVNRSEVTPSQQNYQNSNATDVTSSETTNANVTNVTGSEKARDETSKVKGDEITGTYNGVAKNQLGQKIGFTLKLVQKGSSIGGNVIIAKPFVGSGRIVSGYKDGERIAFTSYNSEYKITFRWEGVVKGNVIEGRYTGTTPDQRIVPNPEYASWRAKRE